jgi:hypothetical protein
MNGSIIFSDLENLGRCHKDPGRILTKDDAGDESADMLSLPDRICRECLRAAASQRKW